MQRQRTPDGIRVRHSKSCGSRAGARCNCKPTYEANVWNNRDQRRTYKAFPSLAAAKAWRRDAQREIEHGTMRAPTSTTLREAAEAWLAGARDGTIRNRKGEPYKPSAIRGYERCLRLRIVPALGAMRLSDLQRRHVQAFVDDLLAQGLDPSTIKNTLNPLQAIYRRAVQRELVALNPTRGLELPRAQGRRDRIASPEEASALLAALPPDDAAVWATALYAGLRRGELRALQCDDVDLAGGVIRVERGWDDQEGEIEGKTRAARRTVPIASVLRDVLAEHKLRTGRAGQELIFGASATRPFEPSTVRRRALAAWEAAGLAPIGLHEARHTFASLMIAAGVNAKALSTYMGHASVSITFDRYGHLMPGNESEAAGMLDAYLARAAAPRHNSATMTPEAVRSAAVESGSATRLESGVAL
jgi:integrase